MESGNQDYIWQDREIRFDENSKLLACRKGEKIIDSINSVEDTKGNNGERGSLIVTNLRLMWISHANMKINLSIGLNTILSINIKKAKSKLKGTTQALCVLAKFSSRFEFMFTSLVKNSPRLFTTVQAVMRAYETSKLYRDLKLRGSVVKDGDLIVLPQEKIFEHHRGIENLSSDQGNLGSFFLTNVRIVWHADLANNFNVSLPYMQIKSIRARDSKFGRVLVIETFSRAGGYILGFKIEDEAGSGGQNKMNRLDTVLKQIQSFYSIFSNTPVFGVDFTVESESKDIAQLLVPKIEDDVEIVDDDEQAASLADYHYYAEMNSDKLDVDMITYDARLGLAIEQLKDDTTLDSLWRII